MVQVIIPNLNRRFSGITSTVASVAPRQAGELQFAAVGYPLPIDIPRLGWRELVRTCRQPLANGRPRIFHARRNNEMIAGLLLKHVLGCRLHLVFTSTAQRHHSGLTRFLYRRMDSLLATSPRAAAFLRREPDAIIPHGVDPETYFPAGNRAAEWQAGGLPGKHGIGILGRVRPQKGIAEFVEAMCRVLPAHPDYTAVIIGEATPEFRPFVAQLQARIRREGLEDRFAWLGKLPFEEVPGWFRRLGDDHPRRRGRLSRSLRRFGGPCRGSGASAERPGAPRPDGPVRARARAQRFQHCRGSGIAERALQAHPVPGR